MQAVLTPKKPNGQNPIQPNSAAQHDVEVNSEAQFNIEQIAETEQDYAVALDHYVSAVNNGSEQALEKIASMQIDLDYFSKGDAQLEGRVEQLIESFNNVASMYSRMNNTDECTKWMTRASSLESALRQIGCIKSCNEMQIDRNELIEKLSAEADRFSKLKQFEAEYIIWQFLAELGNPRAEYCYGVKYFCENFHDNCVVRNVKKGVTWLKKSAEHGNIYAQLKLGNLYYVGAVVTKNIEEALKYFEMAAENKNSDGSADKIIGLIYRYGDGVKKNVAKAFEHLHRGAELGDFEAQMYIGYAYTGGDVVAKNVEVALRYLKMAAKKEDHYCEINFKIGLIYLYGDGVEQNTAKAFKYFKRVEARDGNYAKKNLAKLFSTKMAECIEWS